MKPPRPVLSVSAICYAKLQKISRATGKPIAHLIAELVSRETGVSA